MGVEKVLQDGKGELTVEFKHMSRTDFIFVEKMRLVTKKICDQNVINAIQKSKYVNECLCDKKNTFWCYFITLIALKTKNTIWAQNFSEL